MMQIQSYEDVKQMIMKIYYLDDVIFSIDLWCKFFNINTGCMDINFELLKMRLKLN